MPLTVYADHAEFDTDHERQALDQLIQALTTRVWGWHRSGGAVRQRSYRHSAHRFAGSDRERLLSWT